MTELPWSSPSMELDPGPPFIQKLKMSNKILIIDIVLTYEVGAFAGSFRDSKTNACQHTVHST